MVALFQLRASAVALSIKRTSVGRKLGFRRTASRSILGTRYHIHSSGALALDIASMSFGKPPNFTNFAVSAPGKSERASFSMLSVDVGS